MLSLHQFARTWNGPNLSLFCIKVETYLRMTRLPYEVVPTLPLLAPKGKLPYLTDEGRKIPDSRLIIQHLKEKYGDSLDAHLSPAERACGKAFERMIEEHLYWVTMFSRWSHGDANWQVNKAAIFSVLPPIARDLAAALYRVKIRSQLRGHGLSKLPTDEIFRLGREDVDALADFLGDKPFFLGSRQTSVDACVFAVLVVILDCPIESPLKDHTASKTNLVEYSGRIRQSYFSDL